MGRSCYYWPNAVLPYEPVHLYQCIPASEDEAAMKLRYSMLSCSYLMCNYKLVKRKRFASFYAEPSKCYKQVDS
ncbi:hypothetical protein M514_03959 [Trichuris suis]|uniref:Uncharacterized protein n=1 Tax=Trichuris suis TaxID=68888 RepID=A0A085MRN3_9BILA|nr:hypothetical protein M513_03959 [Trichuris suis]KFD59879.1 hypothetical protein M514_03959 [Trichuris suis]